MICVIFFGCNSGKSGLVINFGVRIRSATVNKRGWYERQSFGGFDDGGEGFCGCGGLAFSDGGGWFGHYVFGGEETGGQPRPASGDWTAV